MCPWSQQTQEERTTEQGDDVRNPQCTHGAGGCLRASAKGLQLRSAPRKPLHILSRAACPLSPGFIQSGQTSVSQHRQPIPPLQAGAGLCELSLRAGGFFMRVVASYCRVIRFFNLNPFEHWGWRTPCCMWGGVGAAVCPGGCFTAS